MAGARELLERYGEELLVSEFDTWDRLRRELTSPTYGAPERASKVVIILDGIPGAGKSTTVRWLQAALGAEHRSLARFAEARGVSADERRLHQLARRSAHPVDEAFVAELAACAERVVIVEKFPRTVVEANTVLSAARRLEWQLVVLHLALPGDCVAWSVARQLARGPRQGRMPTAAHARHRALVHLARATAARAWLREHGVPVFSVDMTRSSEVNAADIRVALGIDWARWRTGPLEVLAEVAGKLGVEAWVSCGGVYRPFWNGVFGPVQSPGDVDVAVNREREAAALQTELERVAPGERWSVLCPSARLREQLGVETTTAVEAKQYALFMHRSGLVRVGARGEVEVRLPEGAEASLRRGVVQLNSRVLLEARSATLDEWVRRHSHHARRALGEYPALRVEAETAQLLGLTAHVPKPVVTGGFRALKARVIDTQLRRGSVNRCRRALNAFETPVAKEILGFHQRSRACASPAPVPRRAGVGATWPSFAEVARQAGDDVFAEWFWRETRRDGAVLRFTGLGERWRRAANSVELGPMHQGWSLERHLGQSVVQLKTDGVVERWRERGGEVVGDVRLSMRVAMLFHDTGKLVGERPRRHPDIGARLFERFRPTWFPSRLVGFTSWLIRVHDVFGAVGRWVTDKAGHSAGDYAVDVTSPTSYVGAIDSQEARRVLGESGLSLDAAAAMSRELWCADVGAIATLRWLLPVAGLIERLLLVTDRVAFAGVERRRR